MPTYVYRCESCANQFELVQRMVDDPIELCPTCEGRVRRVIHPVGVVFKGSGWYINDSRPTIASTSNSTDDSESADKSKDGKTEKKDAKKEPVAAGTTSKSIESTPSKTAAD